MTDDHLRRTIFCSVVHAGTIGVLLALARPALAQSDARDGVTLLPDTVVSASATEIESSAVGSAVTVLENEQLQKRGLPIVSEVLRDVPGVSVNRQGPRGAFTQVRIRGAEASHTLVLINGVEAADPFIGEFNFANLLSYDVERIEVLRGPQSSLWGSDALAGVINIITRQADDGLDIDASAEAGTYATTQGNASVRYGEQRFDVSLSASALSSNGYNVSRFAGDRDGYRTNNVNFRGAVRPTDAIEVRASGTVSDNRNEFDNQVFFGPMSGFVVSSDDVTDNDQWYGRVEAQLDTLDGRWEHVIGGAYTAAYSENFTGGALTSSNDGIKRKLDYRTTYRFDTLSVASARHALSALLENEHETFVNETPGAALSDQKQSARNTALALEYRVDLYDRVSLSGALRHDNNELFKDSNTWRVTGAYRIADYGTRLHASAGKGVTNPQFSDLFGFFPGFFVGNPNLKPEHSKSWDVGVEQSLFNRRVVADLTYFRANLRDEINGFTPTPGGLFTATNMIGTSRRWGFEFSLAAAITQQLRVDGAYTFLRADEPAPNRLEEIRRPKHVASLNLNYALANGRGNVNVGIQHHGRSTDLFFGTFPSTRIELPSYTLINLRGEYQLAKGLHAFARVENLLDREYEEVFSFRAPRAAVYGGLRVDLDAIM